MAQTTTEISKDFQCDGCAFSADTLPDLEAHKARDHRPRKTIPVVEQPILLAGGVADEKGTLHQEIELAPWTGVEEDLLNDAELARTGEHVRRVLANCITRVGAMFDAPFEGRTPAQTAQARRIVNNMLISDKTLLVILLRRISTIEGDLYRFHTECPACKYGPDDKRPVTVLDLRTLEIVPMPDPAKRIFEFRLPQSQKLVRFRHLTCADEPDFIELDKKYAHQRASAQLFFQILDVDGAPLPNVAALRKWTGVDRDALRGEMDRVDGGVDVMISTECPRCKHVVRGPMDMGIPFFFPSQAVSARR